MRGLLVQGGRTLVSINFNEKKARRIVSLLQNIKSSDARFGDARLGIFKRSRPKSFHTFWPDTH